VRDVVEELIVLSGKGGTGKTSIVASLAGLAHEAVLADCDVDAADLPLLLSPTVVHQEAFSGGSMAQIRTERCTSCGQCLAACRFDAVQRNGSGIGSADGRYRIDPTACEGCGVCAQVCPEGAIAFGPVTSGTVSISATRYGPMVYAQLHAGAANSGKLVSHVRARARSIGERQSRRLTIVDGPPGVGCPSIAALTAGSLVLVVTEPTLSAEHDLRRVLQLARDLGIPAAVCVNKWDLNASVAARIEHTAVGSGATVAARVGYDRDVTRAQVDMKTAVEWGGRAAAEITRLWEDIRRIGGRHSIRL
jgi:MinD superfamily P-loop ATPase